MAKSGWKFAVHLSDLKVVGTVDLPAMAYTFAALNNVVGGTEANDDNAFAWQSGGVSQVFGPWSELRDSLQNLLGRTSENIEAAAHAVLQIVAAYRNTDHEAALSLDAAWSGGTPSLLKGEYAPPGPAPTVVLKP